MSVHAAVLALILLCTPGNASAQDDVAGDEAETTTDERARAAFEAGREALASGRYEEALLQFQLSHRLSQRPELLYNVAIAHDRLRHDAEAIEYFERFLTEVPDTDVRADVEARLAVLRGGTEEAPDVADDEDDGGSIVSRWWFWTIVGVVLAGAVTGIVLAASLGGSPEPIAGNEGVVQALRVSF